MRLTVAHTAALWLAADNVVVGERAYRAGSYEEATDEQRQLMEKFLARTERYQTLMLDAVDRHGLDRLDAGGYRSVEDLVAAVLAAVNAQDAVGRSSGGP